MKNTKCTLDEVFLVSKITKDGQLIVLFGDDVQSFCCNLADEKHLIRGTFSFALGLTVNWDKEGGAPKKV